jgi:hypothetical protein
VGAARVASVRALFREIPTAGLGGVHGPSADLTAAAR